MVAGQNRVTTASKSSRNVTAAVAMLDFNGCPLQTRFIAVPLPLKDVLRVEHLCHRESR